MALQTNIGSPESSGKSPAPSSVIRGAVNRGRPVTAKPVDNSPVSMAPVEVWIPGDPVAWARPVATKSGVVNRQKQKEHKRILQLYIRREIGSSFKAFPMGTPVSIRLEFVYAFTARQKREGSKVTRPDLDNLAKQVLDAIQGECMIVEDDGQVCHMTCMKVYGGEPGTRITVQAMNV